MPLSQVKPIDLDLKNPLLDRHQTWLHDLLLQSQGKWVIMLWTLQVNHTMYIGRKVDLLNILPFLFICNIDIVLEIFPKKNYSAT